MNYNELAQKLEEIVAQIESNELTIDELSAKTHEASELVKQCRKKLHTIDAELEKLIAED